jgi:two-component system sensor histidine kinase ChvG
MKDTAESSAGRFKPLRWKVWLRSLRLKWKTIGFSSLIHRIVILNLVGLVALVSGILYLNQFTAGLIDARVQSLLVQGEIIAGAVAASAFTENENLTISPDVLLELDAGQSLSPYARFSAPQSLPIDPEKAAPVLRRLVSPTQTRARVYNRSGELLLDSRDLYTKGQILRFDLEAPDADQTPFWPALWRAVKGLFVQNLPTYEELGVQNGRGYPEVVSALSGKAASVVRVTDQGEMIVSVAVPVRRFRNILGALLLSTQEGDIDAIVTAERMAILRVFLVAVAVMVVLSLLLASTIAGPVRQLAEAAQKVRRSINDRALLPQFNERNDEIGRLARSLHEMTEALYERMDATERFAADVAHELKNPLTSLRSAVETLPLVKNESQQRRLLDIIAHDVKRLDRLISDISNASRLDAELARDNLEPVNLNYLVETVLKFMQDIAAKKDITLQLFKPDKAVYCLGHETRLGQVVTNILDNACSFTPQASTITLHLSVDNRQAVITIQDEGPGIEDDVRERIFERFYTDRDHTTGGFGSNSGLGLSISRQIMESHNGSLTAGNYYLSTGQKAGAEFVMRLPVIQPPSDKKSAHP